MGGKLWDGADLLAALAAVETARAATEVRAASADELVRASSAGEEIAGGSSAEIVGPRAADKDVLASDADDRVLAAPAMEQVRCRAADQPVAARAPGQLTWLPVDEAADHHVQSGVGVKRVVAAAQVADDRTDVSGRAAHLRCAGVARLGVVEGAVRPASVRVPEPLGRGEDQPPIRGGVGGDPVVDAALVVQGEDVDRGRRAGALAVDGPDGVSDSRPLGSRGGCGEGADREQREYAGCADSP